MTKDEIKAQQKMLADAGLYLGKIDGIWGPKSQAALDAYNSASGSLSGLSIAWSAKVSPAFAQRVIQMAKDLKMDSDGPNKLMACMAWETGETFSPSIKNGAGSSACVDVETEILTLSGWKKYDEINVGDRIYSIDFKENKMVEDEILNLTIKESENNVRMTSRSFDSLSSHDHRWYLKQTYYCRNDNTSAVIVKTSEEMLNLKSSHTYSVIHPQMDFIDTVTVKRKHCLEFYTLLGMICGDGSISKDRKLIEIVSHFLANETETRLIDKCIRAVFPNNTVPCDNKKDGENLYRWRFNKELSEYLLQFFDIDYNNGRSEKRFIKKLNPEIFKELDFEAAKALLYGYLISDGHFCVSNNSISFRNAEKEIIDDFMHCAILAGENPRMVVDYRGGELQKFPNGKYYEIRDIFTVYLRMAKHTSCAHHQMKKSVTTDKITVWCPTTNNGNWIARRNGTTYVTGNCGLIQFMKTTALALGTTRDELLTMTAEEQLEYVYQYFKPYTGKIKTLADVYMVILYPKAVGKPEDFVLFDSATQALAYRQNAGVDLNKDGLVTKLEAAQCVQKKYDKGMQAAYRRAA